MWFWVVVILSRISAWHPSQRVYLLGGLNEGWGLGAISELPGGGLLGDGENHGSNRNEKLSGDVISLV